MSADLCDVMVVGGGPAGATLAWRLRQSGMDVVVLDKKPFPRDKVCAGWITPAVVQELDMDPNHYRQDHVFQPIRAFRTGLIGYDQAVDSEYTEPVSYGIRRCEFDHYLLSRSDARLRLGEGVKGIRRHNGLWHVNEAVRAPLLVGAGGHFCPVARRLGAELGHAEVVVAAQEIEFRMTDAQARQCRVSGDAPELYFCPDLKGYGWCFRKGDYLNVGLGREDNHRLGDHVSAFCQFLQAQGRIPADITHRFKGHAYLLYSHGEREPVHEGALLIGDAAGLAYAQSGEGIRPAVESGLLAAEAILNADGNYSYANLQAYGQRLGERFGERGASPLERWVPTWAKQAMGRYLLTQQWFARRVVLDRWFLHLEQPPLAS